MLIKKIKQYAPEKAIYILVGVILALFAAALLVGSYYCLYLFLRELLINNDVSGAIKVSVYVALLLIANAVVYFFAVTATHALAFRLETNLKKEGLLHLMNASFSFIDKNESGRIRKIVDDNTAMTHSSVAHLIPDLATALFTPLLGAVLAFYVDWRLGALFLVSYVSGLVFIMKMMGNQDFMRKYMAAQDKMNAGAVEYVRGVHVLKIFKANISALKDFKESITSYSDLALKYSMSCRSWYVAFQVVYNAVFLVVLFFGYLGTTDTMEQLVKFIFYAFATYVGRNSITKEIVRAYKNNLIKNNYAPRSINSMLASLNSLFSFLGWVGCTVKNLKIQRQTYCSEQKELTREEYERLVRTALKKGNERLAMVIQTICSTGIRVSELSFLTVEALKQGEMEVFLKGKSRKVLLPKELQRRLRMYVKRENIIRGPIFITRSGNPLSRSNIWREMKKLCKESNVDPGKVFPHNLRHLFARLFYKIKKDIVKLADILGHASIDTTRLYIISTGAEHRRYLDSMRLLI